MFFHPQPYSIPDQRMVSFIDADEIHELLKKADTRKEVIREIIKKSLQKNRLSLQETAALLQTTDPELIEEIKNGARDLKTQIYGERIVLFAPLYVGNFCVNDCQYCGFRLSNKDQNRSTLNREELVKQVEALEDAGHKRLVLVFGEHPAYSPKFIAETVKTVYSTKRDKGEIRRVNINAAPFDIQGFKEIKSSGIGTYQIFQETYHPTTYDLVHGKGKKKDFSWRLTSLDRAMEAGIDDVGIGTLLGLYDWRFEVMGLIRHVNHLEAAYNVGPHTISFPRIQKASGIQFKGDYPVGDDEFAQLVAILRLAVPYTGLILTARETEAIRDELISYGVSQIDGGTNIQMKGYTRQEVVQNEDEEQFVINDNRSLSEVIQGLVKQNHIPSFCTACYRLGRTGEHFMEFSVPGFIKRYCQPNALLTFAEYLEDYAKNDVKNEGYAMIEKKLTEFDELPFKQSLMNKLDQIRQGKRDLYY